MVRVLVIGAGLAGLSAALAATSAGHHVVIIEKSKRIGGRGTSQHIDGFAIGYGPHFILNKGPLMKLATKLSKVKVAKLPLRLHRIESVGNGMIRPKGNPQKVVENKKALKSKDATNPHVKSAQLISGWGIDSESRYQALAKGNLSCVGEGWSGLVGRLAMALDEVGVLIDSNLEVVSIEQGKVHLKDGRTIETDVIILACGYSKTRKLVSELTSITTQKGLPENDPITASIVDVSLDSKPLQQLQAIVDAENNMAIFDMKNIHPAVGVSGSLLSAIAIGGSDQFNSPQQRLDSLYAFLDDRASGWRNHIISERGQSKITLHANPNSPIQFDIFSNHNVLLAGDWIDNEYSLADAAVESGRQCGRHVSDIIG